MLNNIMGDGKDKSVLKLACNIEVEKDKDYISRISSTCKGNYSLAGFPFN